MKRWSITLSQACWPQTKKWLHTCVLQVGLLQSTTSQGLAFGKEEVLERIGGSSNIRPFADRPRRVGFAARFDQEKQPGFFMDLIDMYHEQYHRAM
jgi:hypothetical protein